MGHRACYYPHHTFDRSGSCHEGHGVEVGALLAATPEKWLTGTAAGEGWDS